MVHKKEFSAPDAAPVVLYAKNDASSEHAFPVLQGMLNPGFSVPEYDEIEMLYTSGDLTGIVYKNASVTVCTLTLTYTSGNLTGVVKS